MTLPDEAVEALKPMTKWDLDNLKVDDNRLEVLREAYEHLALDPSHSALASAFSTNRRKSDAEHAVLLAELQRHRDRLCRECEGRTYIPNPSARYERDHDGCEYTIDEEEIECPRCDGVGYEPPERPKPVRLPNVWDNMGGEEPF